MQHLLLPAGLCAVARRHRRAVRIQIKFMLEAGEIIDGEWEVKGRVGRGTFSEIYCAQSITGSPWVALKVEPKSFGGLIPVLDGEAKLLSSLQKFDCFPRYHGYWYAFETYFSKKLIALI
jgi:hypothetical protein